MERGDAAQHPLRYILYHYIAIAGGSGRAGGRGAARINRVDATSKGLVNGKLGDVLHKFF